MRKSLSFIIRIMRLNNEYELPQKIDDGATTGKSSPIIDNTEYV
jgi:hypothetical protein